MQSNHILLITTLQSFATALIFWSAVLAEQVAINLRQQVSNLFDVKVQILYFLLYRGLHKPQSYYFALEKEQTIAMWSPGVEQTQIVEVVGFSAHTVVVVVFLFT